MRHGLLDSRHAYGRSSDAAAGLRAVAVAFAVSRPRDQAKDGCRRSQVASKRHNRGAKGASPRLRIREKHGGYLPGFGPHMTAPRATPHGA